MEGALVTYLRQAKCVLVVNIATATTLAVSTANTAAAAAGTARFSCAQSGWPFCMRYVLPLRLNMDRLSYLFAFECMELVKEVISLVYKFMDGDQVGSLPCRSFAQLTAAATMAAGAPVTPGTSSRVVSSLLLVGTI